MHYKFHGAIVSTIKTNFNPTIHGLRGLAATFVLIYHIYRSAITAGDGHIHLGYYFLPQDLLHHYLAFVLQTLNCGIQIFFMISGYLITTTLLHLQNIKQFAINRCLRIYPAFLATQVVMLTVGSILGWTWMVNLSVTDYLYYIVINVLFLPGVFNFNIILPAAWTLSFEALFYTVAACVFLLSQRIRAHFIFILVVVIATWAFYYLPTATFFIPGIICYFLLKKWPENIKIFNIPFLPLLSFIVLIVGLSMPNIETNKFRFLLINIVGLISFYYLVSGYGVIAYVLRTRAFQFLGTISYSLYLWQVPIMFPIKRILLKIIPIGHSYLMFYSFAVCSIVVALLFSYLSYKVLEEKYRDI